MESCGILTPQKSANPVNYFHAGNAVYRIVAFYRFWFVSQSVSFSFCFIMFLRSNQVKWWEPWQLSPLVNLLLR